MVPADSALPAGLESSNTIKKLRSLLEATLKRVTSRFTSLSSPSRSTGTFSFRTGTPSFSVFAVNRGLQIEQQAFSSHLQNVEAGSAGRELKIKAHVSTGFKDFHIVINHHCDGSIFR